MTALPQHGAAQTALKPLSKRQLGQLFNVYLLQSAKINS